MGLGNVLQWNATDRVPSLHWLLEMRFVSVTIFQSLSMNLNFLCCYIPADAFVAF